MAWFAGLFSLLRHRPQQARPRYRARPRQLQISELEPRLLLAGYHLDFGSDESRAASGYVSAPVEQYSTASRAGWTDARGVREVIRSTGTDLTQDFHAEKDRTFRIDVDNGAYLVTPTLGDPSMVRDHIDVYLNGKLVASDVTVAAGQAYRPTFRVDVTGKALTMRLVDRGGETVRRALSALDVVSTSSTAPVVSISPDTTAPEGSQVALKATAVGTGTLKYLWNFGDSTTAEGTLSPKHTYTDDGTYVVTFTATDSKGQIGRASGKIVVKNVAPKIVLTQVLDPDAREGAAVTLTCRVTDPGTEDVAAGLRKVWSVTKNGKAFASASGTMTQFKFTPDDEGTYVVKLTVTDQDGAASATSSITVVATDTPLRANALGSYRGAVGATVYFSGVARDNGVLDAKAGYSYAWKFGDGATATGANATHKYAAPGIHQVTLTVKGRNGQLITTKTTATITTASTPKTKNDYQLLSSNLLANTVYGNLQWKELAASGAWGVNAKWEGGTSSKWYIEQQRNGESLIIDGLLHNDTAAISAGFKAFDWGFKRQASDGSFAGTQDPFHSASFFVAAVARACLVIKQSPLASLYQAKVEAYAAKVYKAAKWMAKAENFSRGISNNVPYTHRRYVVASALGLTSKLVGGDTALVNLARAQIRDGVAQQSTSGVNPESGGYDSSYQAVGIAYAQLWTTYFATDSATPAAQAMINKALAWEHSRILASGEVNMTGNTRTGVETGPSNTMKTVDWRNVVAAFSRGFQGSGDTRWQVDAQKVAECYFKSY